MADAWRQYGTITSIALAISISSLLIMPITEDTSAVPGGPAHGPVIGRLMPAPWEGGSEFVALCGAISSGWSIAVGDDWAAVPHMNASIPKASRDDCIYLAEKGRAFEGTMGFAPSFEAEETLDDVPQLVLPARSRWPRLANDGGVVRLLDLNGTEVDKVVYGDGNSTSPGWVGPPVSVPRAGEILTREVLLPDGGLSLPDTDTAIDWDHLRRHYPRQSTSSGGWGISEGATFIPLPDASAEAVSLIDGTTRTIDVNVYKFTSWPMAERMLGALGRGVKVRILVEGAPVGGMDPSEAYILNELSKTGADVRVMKGDAVQGIHRRYSMDHAKYMIVDGTTVLVSSENWVASGLSGSTTYGNRGWAMIVRLRQGDPCQICELFETDYEKDAPDIIDWDLAREDVMVPTIFPGQTVIREGDYDPMFVPYDSVGGSSFKFVISPDTSLEAIVDLVDCSKERVLVEIFSADLYWQDRRGEDIVNPLIQAVVDSARRGVAVKVLLDKGFAPMPPGNGTGGEDEVPSEDGNMIVKLFLEEKAAAEGLDLMVRWADIEGIELLHNKAMVVDDMVLASSINWVGSSVLSNREVGVVVRDRTLSDKAVDVFLSDWDGGTGQNGHGSNGTGQEDDKRGNTPSPGILSSIVIFVAVAVISSFRRSR